MQKITSINPATLQVLGEVNNTSADEVRRVVQMAKAAQPAWQELGVKCRSELLFKFRDLILDQMDEIADLISRENGKPIMEAIGSDILPAMDLITYFAKKTEKLLRNEKIKLGKWNFLGRTSHLEFYPLGVIAVISPWNFPFSTPVGDVVMALIVGNTVVLKPSEYTTLIGEKIKSLFDQAGFPKDVLQLVTGDGATGAALVTAGVDKISFTGSVATGKKIMAACAQSLTPVTLELGGKDPFIVFADADLDVASSAAVWGAFCNSGQVCASVERLYVEDSIKEKFTDLIVTKTRKLRQGNGQSFDVDVAAMTAKMQLDKVVTHVEDAKKRGAKILVGGERNTTLPGYFYQPTVLTNVDATFPIVAEETFGPVLPIMSFENEAEVVRFANDSVYALNAYVWTSDAAKARRVASQLVAGTVNVNESLFTHALPQTPWGGPKESGVGRTHGAQGLLEMVQVRHVHINRVLQKRNFFWWYGYSQDKVLLFKMLAQVLFGRGLKRFLALLKFLKMSASAKVD